MQETFSPPTSDTKDSTISDVRRTAALAENVHLTTHRRSLMRRYRFWMAIEVLGLLVSGITAFPLLLELTWITSLMGAGPGTLPSDFNAPLNWLVKVRNGLRETYMRFPFIAYGTDWLAYAHIMFAVLFGGTMKRPWLHLWVIEFGLLCCLGIFPLALVAGPLRGIPFGWTCIDLSFGVLGAIPLLFCRRIASELAKLPPEPDSEPDEPLTLSVP